MGGPDVRGRGDGRRAPPRCKPARPDTPWPRRRRPACSACTRSATGLARPELTAATCGLVAVVGLTATAAEARWPARLGPYADRVADATAGAAACTAPVAVATLAHPAGAPARVLPPLTMLATAIGVLAAAISQVAAASPTGSAGGALAAAAGCLVLAFCRRHRR